ncbi:MAG: pyridoxamine 5'-phosphate oxidase family protein [Acidimicrobiia bacterium]
MAHIYDEIDEDLAGFLARQPVFFVATAPSGDGGHLNLSPKGLAGSFAVLDPHTVAYLDLTGSGVETIAHLRENGRIVLMFCAFEGRARIVRLHGQGSVALAGDDGFEGLAARFPDRIGVRSVVSVAVERVADSCGFGVPVMRYDSDRNQLERWARGRGDDGLVAYRAEMNARSIDGLPGLEPLAVPAE